MLCLFTAFSVALLKPPQAAFECADGIAETLEGATPFGRIRCEEEVWGWLEGTVPVRWPRAGVGSRLVEGVNLI